MSMNEQDRRSRERSAVFYLRCVRPGHPVDWDRLIVRGGARPATIIAGTHEAKGQAVCVPGHCLVQALWIERGIQIRRYGVSELPLDAGMRRFL